MTDSEINLAIAKIEYPDYPVVNTKHGDKVICAVVEHLLDYCNNWQDIGPIIEREKIGVYPDSVVWKAFHDDIEGEAESPTKAAALCFLMMKGE